MRLKNFEPSSLNEAHLWVFVEARANSNVCWYSEVDERLKMDDDVDTFWLFSQ